MLPSQVHWKIVPKHCTPCTTTWVALATAATVAKVLFALHGDPLGARALWCMFECTSTQGCNGVRGRKQAWTHAGRGGPQKEREPRREVRTTHMHSTLASHPCHTDAVLMGRGPIRHTASCFHLLLTPLHPRQLPMQPAQPTTSPPTPH